MKKMILMFISFFVFSGCSVVDVEVEYDKEVKIPSLKTYAILQYEFGTKLIDKRVNIAINKELSEKGYKLVDIENADFVVLYRYSSRKKSNTQGQYMRGAGRYGYYGGSYSTSTYQFNEGNFEIRMADPKTKESFFISSGKNTLESFSTADERQEYTKDIVAKMLSDYPDSN